MAGSDRAVPEATQHYAVCLIAGLIDYVVKHDLELGRRGREIVRLGENIDAVRTDNHGGSINETLFNRLVDCVSRTAMCDAGDSITTADARLPNSNNARLTPMSLDMIM